MTGSGGREKASECRPCELFEGAVDRLIKANIWHLVWMTVLFAELLTGIMDTVISYLWWGRFSKDLFIIGTIDAFVVSLVAVLLIVYLVSRLRDAEHGVSVMLAREVDERKRADEERSAFFNMMMHDLKGPLSIIYGYGEILAQEMSDPDAMYMVNGINKAAMRISLLMDDMLALSRIESGKAELNMDAVSLLDVISQAIAENEMQAAEMDLDVGVHLEDDMPEICADKTYLGRAISNLVANAVNYNRQGGSITVRGGRSDGASPGIFVEVSDTGVGISEGDLPRIFDRYFRSGRNSSMKGTGLGLSIVKAVADAHSGKVFVDSQEGKGSIFRVVLPLGPPSCN